MPLDMDAWHLDVCYSCSQKGLGAPSGLSPMAFSPRALERRVACRSFAFDLALLEDFWVRRKYHHTISAPLVYALATALEEVEEEGLEARWARHEPVHRHLVDSLAPLGLGLLPPAAERLWNLNAVAVPDGVTRPLCAVSMIEGGHRNRRGPRPAGRPHLAGRSDGIRRDAAERRASRPCAPERARRRPAVSEGAMKRLVLVLGLTCGLAAVSCATNPATGRRQLILMSEAEEIAARQAVGRGNPPADGCLRRSRSCSGTSIGSASVWRASRTGRNCRGRSPSSTSRRSTRLRCRADSST